MSTKDNFVKAFKELTGLEDASSAGDNVKAEQEARIEPVLTEVAAPVVKETEYRETLNTKVSDERDKNLDFAQFTKGEQTSIPKGMRIIGNVESTDRLQILGKIEGDVITTGDTVITGTVAGNVTANNISLQNAGVKGDIMASGNVTIERDARVIGAVTAQNLRLDGRIKGDIKVEETSEMAGGALVIGNIETGYISTSRGTKIKGNIITKRTDTIDDDDFDIEV